MKERFASGIETGINFCLLFLLTVLPFAHTAALQSAGYLTATLFWIVKSVIQRKFSFTNTSLILPFCGFALMVLFSTITSLNFNYSLHELRGEFGTYFLIFFLAVNNIKSIRVVYLIVFSIFVTSLVISGRGIFEYLSYDLFRGSYTTSFTADVNYLSATLVLLFSYPLSFWFVGVFSKRWVKVALCLLSLGILTCLVFSLSRGGYVALLVEIILLIFIFRKKGWVWKFLLICLLGGILLSTFASKRVETFCHLFDEKIDGPSLLRLKAWKFGLELIVDYPITGIGYGKSSLQKSFSEEPVVKPVGHLHNIFLETALEIGLPGLVCFVWLLLALGSTLKDGYIHSTDPFHKAFFLASLLALVGYTVRNQFDHLYINNLARLFWLLMGVAVALKVNKTS